MAVQNFEKFVETAAQLFSAGVSTSTLSRKMRRFLGTGTTARVLDYLRRRVRPRTTPSMQPPPVPPPVNVAVGIDEPDPMEQVIDTRRVSGHLLRGKDALKEIETPESSNVFSFAYDGEQGILFVTFKAPGPAIEARNGTSICTGEEYTYYARGHVRGPTYAYGGSNSPVPPALYEQMVRASSKGKFVWRALRKCGSTWQHRFPYRLVTASFADGEVYVPRKATRRGFRVRSVEAVPSVRQPGQRPQTISSTLQSDVRPEAVSWSELEQIAAEQGISIGELRNRMAQAAPPRPTLRELDELRSRPGMSTQQQAVLRAIEEGYRADRAGGF